MPGGGLEFACEKPKEQQVEDLEHVMKALQTLESADEKLSVLCKKYAELLEEHRTMQNTLKQTQRTLSVLAREKDQLQNDHSKAVLAKSKLEGLCRELQRHNRLVKDESAARAKEDDDKRKEVAAKFQTTINEIQQQMNDHYAKNSTLREENLELTTKLKGLIEQYELREQHIEKVLKHKDLESQLYDAKLAQATLQLTEEKERNLQEKQQLLQEALENQKKMVILTESEKQLKAQIAMYQEKYDEFQQTLTKSNDVFGNFKSEMDKMSKKMKKLEKETAMYRQRWENSNKALLSMAEEKTRSEREVSVLQNKVMKLESLCRALQEERKKNLPTSSGRMMPDFQMPSPTDKPCEHGCQHHHGNSEQNNHGNEPSSSSPTNPSPVSNGPSVPKNLESTGDPKCQESVSVSSSSSAEDVNSSSLSSESVHTELPSATDDASTVAAADLSPSTAEAVAVVMDSEVLPPTE